MRIRDFSLLLACFIPLFGAARLSEHFSTSLCLRVRGGALDKFGHKLSLRDSGRVGDLWDYHYLTTRSSGNVALFRHRTLGTALELNSCTNHVRIIEHDNSNGTWVSISGEPIPFISPIPLVRNNLIHWDAEDGFLAPDVLEALQNETRSRSLLAEWLDFHEWTVWDDGTKPYMEIQNTVYGARIMLTEDGLVFLGAPAGLFQPRKPKSVIIKNQLPLALKSLKEGLDCVAALTR
ncbi:hypothetical protein GUITHDRAFT_152582 [Guillardia theta CCMP2712]|uniref:Uncharacterized protein n=1 Tax=Guillardia theta (strain CCMP2712) TaxID=905079 RepID=L1JCL7_GUITC|nr:hypothetical protein GUITHDRAFT_152582 [Guillardia theta CCMP2712]EKX45854.1 hypothetical protein GUITHDRAFT_152582 [Guillardia theta CCMP2712]|mmetsp:Transcript_3966/g.14747  ORF Transcript_3966/g.14747 Transcript_3966/m.14747 type:complete len:235 (-) Transcript_3966:1072-1776(-)|eukprot:XP_005832834.1 hypothetical protein GUITHDRAFT_152582 [Guillardia theta CCMP2712]